jgi:hypothetical protein
MPMSQFRKTSFLIKFYGQTNIMKKEEIESNPILKMTFEFSLLILDFCDVLDEMRKYTISRQLLKSGSFSKKYPECDFLLLKLEEIQKVLNKILGTAKKKNPISYFLSFLLF